MQALSAAQLPALLTAWPELSRQLGDAPLALFLDFDGTLVPRADDPTQARVDSQLRTLLRGLGGAAKLAVVTGRDVSDIRARIGLPELHYAGCHGMQIVGPDLDEHAPPAAAASIDAAVEPLRAAVSAWPEIIVEPKRFTISVHHQGVATSRWPQVHAAVARIVDEARGLVWHPAAAAIEVRPDLPMNKGTAVARLLQHFDAGSPRAHVAVALGDDRTDEDAFAELSRRPGSIAAIVGRPPRTTLARWALRDVADARAWLATLCGTLRS